MSPIGPLSCAAEGCTKPPKTGDRFCNAHAHRLNRYGHPLQRCVSVHDLKPVALRIATRLPEDSGVRVVCAERWTDTLAEAAQVLATGIVRSPADAPAVQDRKATSYEREAARLLTASAAETTPEEVTDVVVGLTILRAVAPGTFRDARAFRFTVARRFLGLARKTNGTTPQGAKGPFSYRTVHPEVAEALAGWLLTSFGEIAEALAKQELEEMARAGVRKARLAEAIRTLPVTTCDDYGLPL